MNMHCEIDDRIKGLVLVWIGVVICALMFLQSARASSDNPTPAEFQELLKLDYMSFDQSLPTGGWRSISDNVEAGKILDAYYVQTLGVLEASRARVITWHAGQCYALGSLNDLATARFTKSYNPDESVSDTFKWNAYVRGSIAFLKKDRVALQAARDEMYLADPSIDNRNARILDGFLNCFDKSYSEAYGNCRT